MIYLLHSAKLWVYDYVDIHVAMLEKMYQKRLNGYAGIDYKAKGDTRPADVLAARGEVLIVSLFLTKRRVLSALNYLSAVSAKVTVVTKAPDNYPEKDRAKIVECIELLARRDITVKTKNRIHQKFAVTDLNYTSNKADIEERNLWKPKN
jgi:hypothetical protein